MSFDKRKNILSHLAKNYSEKAQEAIKKELLKIKSNLIESYSFEVLSGNIELLDTIAYRVHSDTVEVIRAFLSRIQAVEFNIGGVFPESDEPERMKRYRNILANKALETLEHIRYHEPYESLAIFFEYSLSEDDVVSKKAIQGLEQFSKYDLDIFYGDGKDWKGLGCQPQEIALEVINKFDPSDKLKHLEAILSVCRQLLTPTMEGTKWSYNKVNIQTGSIPVYEGMKNLRKKTITLLEELYPLVKSHEEKKSVITTLHKATGTPHVGANKDVLAMIAENCISVLIFYKKIASDASEDLQTLQTIEHDTYWLFYHMGSQRQELKLLALEIRDLLYAHKEYGIYRVLVGFESIFHEWERDKSQEHDDDYDKEKEFRESEALRLAKSINLDNYEDWKSRIIRYAAIESNDLATFPYFGKFLEYFSESSPELAIKLLSENSGDVERFLVAILFGLAKTNEGEAYNLVKSWCNEGRYLFNLIRFFEYHSEVDEQILLALFRKAKETENIPALIQVIATVSAKFTDETASLLKQLFMPAIEFLTALRNTNWIYAFWYRKERSSLITTLEDGERQALLDNMAILEEIEYQAEDILSEIAKHNPVAVIEFFCNRLTKEREKESGSKFDAVPYQFRKLATPLSEVPCEAVSLVREFFDGNYGMFIYQGANLLGNIFKDLPTAFEDELKAVLSSGEEDDLLFVLAILRTYNGDQKIQNVCRELIKTLPEDSDLLVEVSIALESTGVVSGEYGLAEAYKLKIEEISSWLEDDDAKVKNFAQRYIDHLQKDIDRETKRADEEIALRKYKYGEDL